LESNFHLHQKGVVHAFPTHHAGGSWRPDARRLRQAARGRGYVPPPPPGAVPGSTAADRDGDGIIDGYYTSDGIYHPNAPAYTPPPMPTRKGERG
jgi:hypothetical protein